MILESGHTYHGVHKERQSYQMLFIENVNADVETQFFEVVLTLNVLSLSNYLLAFYSLSLSTDLVSVFVINLGSLF